MTDRIDDTHIERRQQAVAIGVLQEQVNTLGREMSDLKMLNAKQSEQLSKIIEQLAEARGGVRTMLWFGGAMATFGGAIAWGIEHLLGRAHS